MSHPEKVKLTKAGESITLTVSECGPASVGQYPEIEFIGVASGREVLVPVPRVSADRQLGRIPLEYHDCIGAVLTISRDPNAKDASKPYWGITLGAAAKGNGNGHAKPAPAVTPAPRNVLPPDDAPHPADREPVKAEPTPKDLYLAITKDTLAHVVPLYVAAKIPIEMSAVAAIVATRFITATQRH